MHAPFATRRRAALTRHHPKPRPRARLRRALARGWSVDGPRTARAKVRAARDAGAAGVAVWELGQDLHPDDPRSLLRAIDEEARRGRADGAEGARGETRDEL